MKLIKLISEAETIAIIKGKHTEDDLKAIYLDPNFKRLCDHVAKQIVQAKLIKPHTYRFRIQVHAQDVEK